MFIQRIIPVRETPLSTAYCLASFLYQYIYEGPLSFDSKRTMSGQLYCLNA